MSVTIDTTPNGLPTEFAELDPFADWALERQDDRYAKRLASTMDEMQSFYDTMFPRLTEVTEYCNRFELDDLPEPVRKLMFLTFSLIQASFPVEAWRQPNVPDAGAAAINCIREPQI